MAESTPDPFGGHDNQSNSNASASDASQTEKMVQEALDDAQASLSDMQQHADSASPRGETGADMGDSFQQSQFQTMAGNSGIELLSDVDLQVSIELGRTHMLVEDVLRLAPGSVVELDKLAGDPVDVYVNQRLVARGEVLVLNDNFCIRISEILANLEEESEITLQKAETT